MRYRIFTLTNGCHKACCFYKDCKGFRTKEKKCPERTLNIGWRQPIYDTQSKEKLY